MIKSLCLLTGAEEKKLERVWYIAKPPYPQDLRIKICRQISVGVCKEFEPNPVKNFAEFANLAPERAPVLP